MAPSKALTGAVHEFLGGEMMNMDVTAGKGCAPVSPGIIKPQAREDTIQLKPLTVTSCTLSARPQSAGQRARPQSARPQQIQSGQSARPQTARPQSALPQRPQSARLGPSGAEAQSALSAHFETPSCPTARPQSARQPKAGLEPLLAAKALEPVTPETDEELQEMEELEMLRHRIGHKASIRYSNLNDAFKGMDRLLDRNGMREIFHRIHMPPESADRFVELLGHEASGEINARYLRGLIGNYTRLPDRSGAKPKASEEHATRAPKQETELNKLSEMVANKVSQYRTRNRDDAFSVLDNDLDGYITRDECLRFLDRFGFPSNVGEHVFQQFVTNTSGPDHIAFDAFISVFGKGLSPSRAQARVLKHRTLEAPIAMMANKAVDLEKLGAAVGNKAGQKFRNLRQCVRTLDFNREGKVSRSECIEFLEQFGFEPHVGESVFAALGVDKGAEKYIQYNTFISIFGPHISPGYEDLFRPTRDVARRSEAVEKAPAGARPQSAPTARGSDIRLGLLQSAALAPSVLLTPTAALTPLAPRTPRHEAAPVSQMAPDAQRHVAFTGKSPRRPCNGRRNQRVPAEVKAAAAAAAWARAEKWAAVERQALSSLESEPHKELQKEPKKEPQTCHGSQLLPKAPLAAPAEAGERRRKFHRPNSAPGRRPVGGEAQTRKVPLESAMTNCWSVL